MDSMSGAKILIVDDEPGILKTVRAYLEREGYAVETALDGPSALKAARAFTPDLIILDIMLPGMDGLEVLRRLRQERGSGPSVADVYVLMLTARTDEMDKVIGLTVGADDYMTKPFSPRELVARVKAILRRGRTAGAEEGALIYRHVRVDPAAHQAWKDDMPLDLTAVKC
jgi:two-component system, OmpR family, alkaline phosphatase synthesis response regulator PhoP